MWNQKLTQPNDRGKVIQLRAEGLTNRMIAQRMNMSDATVSRILSKEPKPAGKKRGG
jgi:DNA-binding NarL/FixJ family response regulator